MLNLAPLQIYLGWMLLINLITAVAYASDKNAARRGQRRTPERTLFALNLAGGVAGAWLAFLTLRHKTRHGTFWLVQGLCTALHLALLAGLLAAQPR